MLNTEALKENQPPEPTEAQCSTGYSGVPFLTGLCVPITLLITQPVIMVPHENASLEWGWHQVLCLLVYKHSFANMYVPLWFRVLGICFQTVGAYLGEAVDRFRVEEA